MYIDLILVIVLIILGIFYIRKFSSFVYLVAIIDIFFRLMNFIRVHVNVYELKILIRKYIPASIPHLLDKYLDGIILEILLWGLFVIYAIFLFYVVRTFFRKKH